MIGRSTTRTFAAFGVTAIILSMSMSGMRPSETAYHVSYQYPPSLHCLNRRGKNGTWITSAEGYTYGKPLNVTGDAGSYAKHTKWKWHDSELQCQIQLLTAAKFCDVMDRLELKRVFFVGDSLTDMMALSLWSMLTGSIEKGHCGLPNTRTQPYINFFDCNVNNNGDQQKIEFHYSRNDRLSNVTAENRKLGYGGIHYELEWQGDYASNPIPTLLIANTGMHFPGMDDYTRDFSRFIHTIESFDRPQDFVVYRSNVPGHSGCSDDSVPLAKSTDFQVDTVYNWALIEDFNNFTAKTMAQLSEKERWMLLDVHPMTILRPDGHFKPPVDCLHYKLPGPPDFWNHLMYSNLLDVLESR